MLQRQVFSIKLLFKIHFAVSFPPDAHIDDAILQYLCPLVCTLTPPHFAYCLLGDVAGEAESELLARSHSKL